MWLEPGFENLLLWQYTGPRARSRGDFRPLRNRKHTHDTRTTPKQDARIHRDYHLPRTSFAKGATLFVLLRVAVALRGDRGSQHRPHSPVAHLVGGWRSPPRATEDRNPPRRGSRGEPQCGGRLPGRPRVATGRASRSRTLVVAAALRGGRGSQRAGWSPGPLGVRVAVVLRDAEHRNDSFGGAAGVVAVALGDEDRNDEVVTGIRHHLTVGVVLRGGLRIATRRSRTGRRCWTNGGRPPGRPSIATSARSGRAARAPRGVVALRGERGSQLGVGGLRGVERRWRSSFGTTEGRNAISTTVARHAGSWR